MFDPELYREKAEIEEWRKRDPLPRLTDWMREVSALHDGDLTLLERTIAEEIAAAVDFAEAGEWEPVEDLLKDVYAGAPT
jgi:TPP-dependent pyruvate/acetoin dehydrogenase alpha subunit